MLYFTVLLSLLVAAVTSDEKCVIPSDVQGTWFFQAAREQLVITETSVLPRGKCIHSEVKKVNETDKNIFQAVLGDNATYHSFIIEQRLPNGTLCYSCMDFGERGSEDERIMFFDFDQQRGICDPRPDPLSKLCEKRYSASIYRVKVLEQCPFASSTFEYEQALHPHEVCYSHPGCSNVSVQVSGKKLSCELSGTTKRTKIVEKVELECMVTWKGSMANSFHLIGKSPDEDRYRCFFFDMKSKSIDWDRTDEDCLQMYRLLTQTHS